MGLLQFFYFISDFTAATFGYENITDSLVTVTVTDTARRAVRNIVDISMFIRTRQPWGQIFYLGSALNSPNDETYIAAQLGGGELLIRIHFNGTTEAYTVGGVKLDNGYNHLIQASLFSLICLLHRCILGMHIIEKNLEKEQLMLQVYYVRTCNVLIS